MTTLTPKQKEARRKKSLGELGELFAIKALVDRGGYNNIENLNDKTSNEKFADLLCEKKGEKIVISVKARNKYNIDGKLNAHYNLCEKPCNKAKDIEKKYNAKAYWMAIQFDADTYSVYFGSLASLDNLKKSDGKPYKSISIPIKKCKNGQIGEIWVDKKRHFFDFDFYKNK